MLEDGEVEVGSPNKSVRLHVVRVDSPMKGAVSAQDEMKLSFAVVSIDLALRRPFDDEEIGRVTWDAWLQKDTWAVIR